ncbi:MAG: GNAT family N-acetyltransferase [Pseudomonadota bacterium]
MDPDAPRHHFDSLMAQDDTPGWVAINNADTVGYLTATVERRPENLFRPAVARLMIEQIGVGPNAPRSGAGRALITAARGFAQTTGLPTLALTTYAANTGAHAFFAAVGFETVVLKQTMHV